MRNLLITIAPVLVWIFAFTEIVVAVFCISRARKTLSVLCSFVSAGLAVDAAIIAAGSLIGAGPFLQGMSQVRYVLHGSLIPLLIPIAFHTYGIERREVRVTISRITAFVMLAGIIMGIITVTEPVDFAGVLRYAQSDATPKFAKTVNMILSFGGVIPLIIVGIVHFVNHKSPFLMLSGLIMLVFSAIAPATGNMDLNFLTTMIGEDLMVLFFGLELHRLYSDKSPKTKRKSTHKKNTKLTKIDKKYRQFYNSSKA